MDPKDGEEIVDQAPEDDAPPATLRDELEAAVGAAELEAGEAIDSVKDTTTERPQAESKEEKAAADRGAKAPADSAHADDDVKYPTLTAERTTKAPEGWRPAAREGWDQLPEQVRREIHRRELDIATGLQGSTDARKHHDHFNSVVQPYAAIIASEGATSPMDAVEGLMKTAAQLSMGTPRQKAQRMSQLITHYGIDLDELDTMLAGSISGQEPPPEDPNEAILNKRLAPLEEFMQNVNGRMQESQQQSSQQVAKTVEDFAMQAEFMEDVRLDMADLLDMAAQRNRSMTIREAYDTACRLHPEVRRVLARRAEQETKMGARDRVRDKVAAASVSRAPGRVGTGVPAGAQNDGSVRASLMASIDALEN